MSANNQRMVRVTGTGSVYVGRATLCSISIATPVTAGRLTLTNGNGGTTLCDIDTAAAIQNIVIYLGEDSGILFPTEIWVSAITNITAATIFFSG